MLACHSKVFQMVKADKQAGLLEFRVGPGSYIEYD